MRGHEAIVEARLDGVSIARVDVDILPGDAQRARWQKPGLEVLADVVVGRVEVRAEENAALLDFRCCHALPVLILAPSYAQGWPFAQRIADVGPASMTFCAPEIAVRINDEGMAGWEM